MSGRSSRRCGKAGLRPRLALFFLCGLGAIGPAAAQPAPPSPEQQPAEPLVNNVFYETDLQQALADISGQTGVTIATDPSVRGLVTVELEDVPLSEAIELLLAGTGYHFIREPRYYLVFSPAEDSEVFAEVSRTRLVKLTHTTAKAAQDLLPPRLRAYVQIDADSNTAAVTAPPQLLERILADLAEIDSPREHVMLDCRVVVLETRDLLDIGVNWDFPAIQAGTFIDDATRPFWPWGLRIGYTPGREFTQSLMLTLNLLTQNQEATILASPQVLAQDAKMAEISVTNEEYFEILTEGVFVRSQLEQIVTGTILKITPRIGADGKITLEMDVEVSDVVARGRSNLPVVSRRTAHSTVQVESGGTAAIGGLMEARTDTDRRGVPGAEKLPGVGALFRHEATAQGTQQVAVFITATLVESEEELFQTGQRRREHFAPVDPELFREQLRDALHRLDSGERP